MTQDTMRHCGFSRLRRGFLAAIAVAAIAGVATSSGTANAQSNYPNKPIKLVVGFAAGGPTDILARVVGAGMSKVLGEQFYIENRTGSGGNIATEVNLAGGPRRLYAPGGADEQRNQ